MFGKLMNNYYYGKSGKGDYRKEDLPKNRWELFWEMLRVRLSGLMRLNLMYVVAWLPALLVILLNVSGWYGTLGSMLNEAGQLTGDVIGMTNSVLGGFCLLMIPCLLITGPVQAGLAYITRNWARDEHAFIWSDFKDAVKENWKYGLGISAITAVMPMVIYTCFTFYGDLTKQSALYIVPQMITVTLGILWMLGTTFMYPIMVSYKVKFKGVLKNSMMLAIARLPHTIVIRLAALLPAILCILIFIFTGTIYSLLALML